MSCTLFHLMAYLAEKEQQKTQEYTISGISIRATSYQAALNEYERLRSQHKSAIGDFNVYGR